MKKILLNPIVYLSMVIIIGLLLYLNRTTSIITLDINPSIQINLKSNNRVKKVIALNEDAKEVISNNLNGKTIDDAINTITSNIVTKGYVESDQVEVILYSSGIIKNDELGEKIKASFNEYDIFSDVIIVDDVTKKDEDLAKKHNISPAKAYYINSLIEENDSITVEDLLDKTAKEIKESKETGKYCDNGYTLDGDRCLKEINRVSASNGMICPNGYMMYENNCYKEVPIEHTDKLECRDEFNLREDKCIRTSEFDAKPSKVSCPKGIESTYYDAHLTEADAENANDVICLDTTNAKHPVSPCETHDGTEYTVANGKCYWHRAPVIAAGCPGKVQVKGTCWDDATGIYICEGDRDGRRYTSRDEYCEKSIKYIKPTVLEYTCPEGYEVKSDKCTKDEVEDAQYEQICPQGYDKVNNDRCINFKDTEKKEEGLVCNHENAKLKGTECIIYDVIESKKM